MKKFVSTLLALALVLSMTTAFAAGSRGSDDIANVTTEEATVAASIVESEAVEALKAKLAEGDLSAVIPEDVLALIPEEFRSAENIADNIKEIVALKLEGEADGPILLTLNLDTPYEDGTELIALLGVIVDEEVAEWIVKEGTVKDNAITVELTEEEAAKLLNQTFATIIFNK